MRLTKNIFIFIAVLIVSIFLVSEIRGYYSDEFENFLIGIALTSLVIFVWNRKIRKQSQNNTEKKITKMMNALDEETVNKIQNDFEKGLSDTYLPDAITHRELYVYSKLMRDWFSKLAGKGRYDDKMIQKIRNDWVDYIISLRDRNTYNFLSLESDNKEDEESYREQHINASRKAFAIEDAFASAISDNAVRKLDEIRRLDFHKFSREGELAPEGYTYNLKDALVKDEQNTYKNKKNG